MQRLALSALISMLVILITGCSAPPASPALIRGKVTMGDEPVSDLAIQLANDGDSAEATTGSDGSFAFNNVAQGSRTLSLTTTIEGRECEISTTILDVEAGQTITTDIEIPTEL